MDYKRHLNSYFQVVPDRSGMLLFPLGFHEGSCSNACPVEGHVKGSRTTQVSALYIEGHVKGSRATQVPALQKGM